MQITGGFLNSRKIKTGKSDNIKPTLSKTRQGIFNSLVSVIDFEGKSFLDMYSGSGIMSIEAISRGFDPVYSFELDVKTALGIKEGFKSLNITSNVHIGNSLKLVTKLKKQFDVIFIDPPYESDLYEKSLKIILEKNILKEDGIIILEYPIAAQIDFCGLEVVKNKEYGKSKVTFLKNVFAV